MNLNFYIIKSFLLALLLPVTFVSFSQSKPMTLAVNGVSGIGTSSVVVDAAGNIYTASMTTHIIQKTPVGSTTASTIATGIANPRGLALSPDETYLYVGSGNNTSNTFATQYPGVASGHCVYRIKLSDNTKEVFAGTAGTSGNTVGNALSATKFSTVTDVICDKNGNVYIVDNANGDVEKVTVTDNVNLDNNIVSTIINGSTGFAGDGSTTGLMVNNLSGIAFDETNNIFYLADRGNNRIRKVDLNNGGLISTIAGNGNTINSPTVTYSTSDSYYIASNNNVNATSVPLSGGLFGLTLNSSGNVLFFTDAGIGGSGTIASIVRRLDLTSGIMSIFTGRSAANDIAEYFNVNINYPTDVYISPNGTDFYVSSQNSNGPTYKITSTTLPVKLTSFTAKQNLNGVTLNWITASENNTDRFEIMRSEDGNSFTVIGSRLAAGNTNKQENYSFTDALNTKGAFLYYKLRIIDFNGESTNSGVCSINNLNGNIQQTFVYVNHSSKTIMIHTGLDRPLKVKLFNVNGNLINTSSVIQEGIINTVSLANGLYLIKIYNQDGSILVKKILL